jgi:hypothetical protein
MTYFRFAASHFWPAEQNATYLTNEGEYLSLLLTFSFLTSHYFSLLISQ